LLAAAAPLAASPADLQPADLATGRGLTYEWELFLADVLRRLALVESGTGGGGGGLSYVHTQNAPAATWTISHNLGTAPALELVADDGTELYAEVHHPDLNTVVIIFGQPWSGTAYLYG
jgi:hypothetical protein